MATVNNDQFKACFCDGSCIGSGICGAKWYGPNMEPGILTIGGKEDMGIGFNIKEKDIGIFRTFGDKLRHLSETYEERHSQEMRQAAMSTFHNLKPKLESVAENGGTIYRLEEYELSHDADQYFNYLEEILRNEGLTLVHYGDHQLGVRWDVPEG